MRALPTTRTPFDRLIALTISSISIMILAAATTVRADTLPETQPPAPTFQHPETLPAFAESPWEATVLLKTRSWSPGQGRDTSTGSGLFVAHDARERSVLIATSAHVVPCDSACVVHAVFRNADGRAKSVRARRLWHDHRSDLAILRAPVPREAVFAVARPATTDSNPGERVLAIGFPDPQLRQNRPLPGRIKLFSDGHLLDAATRFRAAYRGYASTAIEGVLAPEVALIHTADLLPGSSGGPLIDADGRVIGINTGSLVAPREQGCVVGAAPDGLRCLQLAIRLDAVLEIVERLMVENLHPEPGAHAPG